MIVRGQALLLGAAAVAALRVPELRHARTVEAVRAPTSEVHKLLRLPPFRQLVLVAALVLGSHAMHDAFAVIRWRAAKPQPGDGECALVGGGRRGGARVLPHRPGARDVADTGRGLVVAALAGLVRWAVMAQSAAVLALALVQPLHGLTFALLHLACMRLLADRAAGPGRVAGRSTARSASGHLCRTDPGLRRALRSGRGAGVWAMAALCALAVPLTWPLRQPAGSASRA